MLFRQYSYFANLEKLSAFTISTVELTFSVTESGLYHKTRHYLNNRVD